MTHTRPGRPKMPEKNINVMLRVPEVLLQEIDDWRSDQVVPPSRTQIFLVAVKRMIGNSPQKPEREIEERSDIE